MVAHLPSGVLYSFGFAQDCPLFFLRAQFHHQWCMFSIITRPSKPEYEILCNIILQFRQKKFGTPLHSLQSPVRVSFLDSFTLNNSRLYFLHSSLSSLESLTYSFTCFSMSLLIYSLQADSSINGFMLFLTSSSFSLRITSVIVFSTISTFRFLIFSSTSTLSILLSSLFSSFSSLYFPAMFWKLILHRRQSHITEVPISGPSGICLPRTELLQSPFRTEFSMNVDDPCGVIADFWGVIADPCGVVAIPEVIGGRAVAGAAMSVVARLAKHHKTLSNIVKHHETLVNIVIHRKTSWTTSKTSRNT